LGEVGAKRRVRGYALSIDRNPSPEFLAALEIRPLPTGKVASKPATDVLLTP
jgi:hypothetical protein